MPEDRCLRFFTQLKESDGTKKGTKTIDVTKQVIR